MTDRTTQCPGCNAENQPMGVLGRLVHYRCRNCGGGYSVENPSFEEDDARADAVSNAMVFAGAMTKAMAKDDPLQVALAAFEEARFERAKAMNAFQEAIDALRPLLPVQRDQRITDSQGRLFTVKRISFDHDIHGKPGWFVGGPAVRANGTQGTMARHTWLKLDGSK